MRKALLERLAGRVVQKTKRGPIIEKVKEDTVGGILRWTRENSPELAWVRKEIRKTYGGRAPKVLDPFAGGGAIPLEAMRLGCETTAMDINPVAWFILKCTLEYPRKFGGQTYLLPEFTRRDRDFMKDFLKAKGLTGAKLQTIIEKIQENEDRGIQLDLIPRDDPMLKASLAWHVQAWSRRVMAKVRKELASCYPTYAEFEVLQLGKDFEPRPMQLLEVDEQGISQVAPLNAEFEDVYLNDPRNPRWLAKPTIAYLWTRAVKCKQCRSTLPLLKTRWLCKNDRKRVLLTMESNRNRTGVIFGVQVNVPKDGANAAQQRKYDRSIGAGTMSRTGATCPCCHAIMTMEDIRLEGQADRLSAIMTAVVVSGPKGKEYRRPTQHEIEQAEISHGVLQTVFARIPFGVPHEPLPARGTLGFRVPLYGFKTWQQMFTDRQLTTLGTLIKAISEVDSEIREIHDSDTADAIVGFLACIMERQADYGSAGCIWLNALEAIGHQFSRFALPFIWDFAEVCPFTESSGGLESAYKWVTKVVDHLENATLGAPEPRVLLQSALSENDDCYDVIITDPPYYDAIPYSDLMDFFYIWLRRLTHKLDHGLQEAFPSPLGPKWDRAAHDGELIDDASRFGNDKARSRLNYEDGMARAFSACARALRTDGRLVVVFASKNPTAWETLVTALIRAGFVVNGSWPIQTELQTRLRSVASAALASSIWLVCCKRTRARPGWDSQVLDEMRRNITQRLRDFWDAGIRGPDFVWSATGPALEAFSQYPVVKKANAPNQLLTVAEFLRAVRRMVADFVVGRVLSRAGSEAVSGLDDVTTYYLLHRHDYGLAAAPVGGCILYALSCNLSDTALVNRYDLLTQSGISSTSSAEEDDAAEAVTSSSGTAVRLKVWSQRKERKLGLEVSAGQPIPLIDQVHRLMHLWRTGDQIKVNEYLDLRGLQQNSLFHPLLQALIELSDEGSDERSLLEALSNHIAARGDIRAPSQQQLL